MTARALIRKQARLAVVLSAVFIALVAAVFPYASIPAAGVASTGGITSQVIQSTGGGQYTAYKDCPTGYVMHEIYFRKLAFDNANAMTMVEGSCIKLAADGLSNASNFRNSGSYVGAYVAASQYSHRCGGYAGETRVIVGARIYKTQGGYASGYQLICRNLPDTLESTEYWTGILSGENNYNIYEDIRCPTGTAVLGLYLTYGSIVDRLGFRCGPVIDATQTVTFGSLSDRTLGDANFNIGATTNGAGSLGYNSSTTNVCTVNGLTVSLVSNGTCTITATATSTTNWAQGSQVQSFTVNLPATPTFGSPTSAADGFTFQISNYQSSLTWTGTSTNGGSVAISNTGLVTVTGLAPATNATVTINNHPSVSSTQSGSSFALCNSTSSNQDGYTVIKINNVGDCTWVTPSSVSAIQVAVVAGGGGGGFGNNGAGGGAGEVLVPGNAQLSGTTATSISSIATSPGTSYLVSIGAGGASGAPQGATESSANWAAEATANFGGNGSSSRFGSIVADGGGGGGGANRIDGGTGGSGGGGAGGIGTGLAGQTDNTVPAGWTSFKNVGWGQPAGLSGSGNGGGAGGPGTYLQGGPGITIWGFKLAGGGGGWVMLGAEGDANDTVLGGNGRTGDTNWPYAGTPPNYTSAGVNGTGTGGGAGAPGGSGVVLIRYAGSYTITYNSNGAQSGAPSATSSTYTTDGSPATLATGGNLAKTGYTFAGWSTTSSGVVVPSSYAPTSNVTLYAVWQSTLEIQTPTTGLQGTTTEPFSLQLSASGGTGSRSYTVSSGVLPAGLTLNSQSGMISGAATSSGSYTVSIAVTDDSGTAETADFNITFIGEPLASPGTPSASATIATTKSITVTWSSVANASSYLVKIFDSTGANLISTLSVAVSANSVVLNPGNFASIANSTSYRVSVTAIGTGNFITSVESPKVLATTNAEYTLSYNANGATSGSVPASQLQATGGQTTLRANSGTLARTGYTFGGWHTAADGTSGVSYSVSQQVTAPSDLVLYAKWDPISCTTQTDTTSVPGYTVLKFTGTSACVWTNNLGTSVFDIAVIGGGGGGGWGSRAAGGGAGQVMISKNSLQLGQQSSFLIQVGSGGSAPGGDNLGAGANGQTSSIQDGNGVIATALGGGGGGGGASALTRNGRDGGSGGGGIGAAASTPSLGGAGSNTTSLLVTRDPSAWNIFGNAGEGLSVEGNGGGGGGAGSAAITNGHGGIGVSLWDSPSLKVGGGGGGIVYSGVPRADAQAFGGGRSLVGNVSCPSTSSCSGVTNTGGGGGVRNNGGSGLIALRYANTYTITYNAYLADSGTPSVATSSYTSGTASAALATVGTMTRSGYVFAGWSSTQGGATVSNFQPTSNVTVYASWSPISYTLKLTSQGSSTTQLVPFSSSPSISAPTRLGYTLEGWSQTSGGQKDFEPDLSDFLMPLGGDELFAVWGADENTVTFKANYPSGPSDSTQSISSDVATSLSANAFSRAGYRFNGWNTLANGSGTGYSNSQVVTIVQPLTLYAQWAAETYTVTFNYNGATGGNSRSTASYTTGDVVVTLPAPTKTGYRFEGWFEASNFSGTALGTTYTTTQSRTIYASWSTVTYTILFEYNGATSQNTTASASYTTGASGISLPATLKSGHTFAGWFTSSSLIGTAVSAPYTTSVNQTLYAKWNAIDYALTYNPDINVSGNTVSPTAGSVPVDQGTYNIGNQAVVLANSGSLARTGYEFAGWVTSSAGTGTALNAGDAITFGAANVNLYPKWTAGQYSISYNVNGATGTPARTSDNYTTLGSSITLPGVGSMVRSGYTFGGWSTTVNGAALANSNYTTTQNVVLYAVWTLTDFDVTFNLNGGSGASAPTTLTANVQEDITIPGIGLATKTGHWFSGWNTQLDGSGTSYGAGQTLKMPLGGAALYAVWVPDQYRISYNANGGNGGPNISGGFDSATFSLPYTIRAEGNLARAGYNFSHWSTNVGGTGLKYDDSGDGVSELLVFTPVANTTFYAQWSAIEYAFSFNPNGGSISPQNQVKTIGQSLTLPSAGFKVGYSFAGWSDGTTLYQAATSFPVSDSAVAFVASWSPNVYRVSFDWQGAQGTPTPMQNYTYGTGGVTLPALGNRVKDGYSFSGWATAANGPVLASFEPTADTTLYGRWVDGNYSITFDAQGGSSASALATVARGTSTSLPTSVRDGFVFLGWYTDPTVGTKIGNGGAAFTPAASQTLYAKWVQRSLFGVDLASLETGVELTASSGSALDNTITHLASSSSARIQVPAGSLPNGTKINIRYFKETLRQADLIPGENNYLFSVLVSWLLGTGSSATVPDTDANKPITVTLTNSAIKAGTSVFMVIGDQVTPMGRATQDGSITVELFEDPELVVAQTKPDAPTSLSAVAANSSVALSWSAPVNNGGAAITSYTVTATPGGATCVTVTTSCTISGLTDGTSYTFTVTAQNTVGSSQASAPVSVAPGLPSQGVTSGQGSSTSNPSAPVSVAPGLPSQGVTSGQGSSTPNPAAGLTIVGPKSVSINDNVVLEGTNFSEVTKVKVGGVEASFFVNSDGRITIRVPADAPAGLLDIEFIGSFGSITLQDAITVAPIEVATDRRVTIGTFLGKAAVYTKNHKGKTLSIRIGNKWQVIRSLKVNYSYHFTKVGTGKTITVMAFIDKKLAQVKQIKIR